MLIILKYALQARKISNDTKIPYYTYRRSVFDPLFVFSSNDSVDLSNDRSEYYLEGLDLDIRYFVRIKKYDIAMIWNWKFYLTKYITSYIEEAMSEGSLFDSQYLSILRHYSGQT